MASISECLAQLGFGSRGRPKDGNEDEPQYDPMPFMLETQRWGHRYFAPDGRSRAVLDHDEEGITKMVFDFLQQDHVRSRFWPLVTDTERSEKVCQWPRDRIV